MKKTQITAEEIAECLAGVNTKEWNESISKRLEPLRAFLDADEWKKGISIYLRATQGTAMARLLNESMTHEGYQYLRGFIAALRLVICLPQSIEGQIQQEQNSKEKGIPTGSAGY